MEDIVESFAKRLGIKYKAAKQGIAIRYRYFLQVSEPIKATGRLSMLPSRLTDLLTDDEKNEITTNQEDIPPEEVIEKYQMNTLMVISKKQKRYMKKQ